MKTINEVLDNKLSDNKLDIDWLLDFLNFQLALIAEDSK